MFCAPTATFEPLAAWNHGGQQDGRGKKGDLVAGMAGNKRQKGIDKGLGFGRRFVHLPIGGNQSSYVTCFGVPHCDFIGRIRGSRVTEGTKNSGHETVVMISRQGSRFLRDMASPQKRVPHPSSAWVGIHQPRLQTLPLSLQCSDRALGPQHANGRKVLGHFAIKKRGPVIGVAQVHLEVIPGAVLQNAHIPRT